MVVQYLDGDFRTHANANRTRMVTVNSDFLVKCMYVEHCSPGNNSRVLKLPPKRIFKDYQQTKKNFKARKWKHSQMLDLFRHHF